MSPFKLHVKFCFWNRMHEKVVFYGCHCEAYKWIHKNLLMFVYKTVQNIPSIGFNACYEQKQAVILDMVTKPKHFNFTLETCRLSFCKHLMRNEQLPWLDESIQIYCSKQIVGNGPFAAIKCVQLLIEYQ